MLSKPIEVTQQLSVFVANQPGTFAAICRTLSSESINIHAFTTSDTVDHQVIRLIVENPRQAVRALERRGALVLETPVIVMEGDNRPGSLAELTQVMADEGANIEYAYCATPPHSEKGLLVLRPNSVTKAMRALNRRGMKTSATKPKRAAKKPAATRKAAVPTKRASSAAKKPTTRRRK